MGLSLCLNLWGIPLHYLELWKYQVPNKKKFWNLESPERHPEFFNGEWQVIWKFQIWGGFLKRSFSIAKIIKLLQCPGVILFDWQQLKNPLYKGVYTYLFIPANQLCTLNPRWLCWPSSIIQQYNKTWGLEMGGYYHWYICKGIMLVRRMLKTKITLIKCWNTRNYFLI